MAYFDTVIQWFKSRMKPNQDQFEQTWKWVRWKDEKIAIADIKDLTGILEELANTESTGVFKPIAVALSGDGHFDFPAGLMLDKMLIKPTDESSMLMGLTEGGGELYTPGDPIPAGKYYPVTVDLIADGAVVRIYWSNITSPHMILIYTRTLSFDI
ncbi:MAG: hypothetical protein QM768_21870 [Agriterribacter sp.]